jgi:hypothetical protein
MAGDVRHAVGLDDSSLRIDDVRAALRILRIVLLGCPLRLVALTDPLIDVGEQAEGEAVLLGECLVVLGTIERSADDLDPLLLELRGSVTEPLSFSRSARGEGFGEPEQDQPLSAKVNERHWFSVLVGEGEVGSLRAFSEHDRPPSESCL